MRLDRRAKAHDILCVAHFAALCCLFRPCLCTTYHDGDFVATARKYQFQQTRSEWHDLLGRHCPRFNVEHLAVVPLLKPFFWTEGDEYKMMLSFDTERVLTPWLTIIGKHAPKAPLITVTLTSVGNVLRSAHAQVSAPDDEYLKHHPALLHEYEDPNRWPKHVLILYRWEQFEEVDALSGLFVLLLLALVVFMLLMVMGVAKVGGKLEPAVMELINNIELKEQPESSRAPESSGYPRPPMRPPPPKYGAHHD